MKKLLSASVMTAIFATQPLAAQNAFSHDDLSSETSALMDDVAIAGLRASVLELTRLAAMFEGTEGDQIIALTEELIAALEARDGEAVFNKGRELLSLIAKIAQNDDINIQEGLDNIGRLVDAIRNQDPKSAAAAITDLALFIARIARTIQS